MAAPSVVFVDIDDTLIRSVGNKRIPMPHVVRKVRELSAQGCRLFAWSAGGGDCAKEVAQELNLADLFEGFLPEPTIMIDDLRPEHWRSLQVTHPNELL